MMNVFGKTKKNDDAVTNKSTVDMEDKVADCVGPTCVPVILQTTNDEEVHEVPSATDAINLVDDQDDEVVKKVEVVKVVKVADEEVPTCKLINKEDILAYMDILRQTEIFYNRYKPGTGLIFRQKSNFLDSLHYLEKSFAMVENKKNGRILLKLRIGNENVVQFINRYKTLTRSKFPKGSNWFDLDLDCAIDLEEVYELLDFCYALVVNHYYPNIHVNELTNQLKSDRRLMKPHHLTSYKKLVETLNNRITDTDSLVIHHEIHLPSTVSYLEHRYGLLYEKSYVNFAGVDHRFIQIVVSLCRKGFQEQLMKHPNIIKARFPKGDYWYLVPIDKSFTKIEEVFELLEKSREHIIKLLAEKEAIKKEYLAELEEVEAR